jgi:hypothetical protein
MSRWLMLTVFSLILGIALNGLADTRTLVIQRGFNQDGIVEDTLLYAPESVMNVNYGDYSTIIAGCNRWGELQVALIRFDLSDVPPVTKIVDATLCLYDVSAEWPNQDLIFDVYFVSQENAGWMEGDNDGTRVPVKGTSCWKWLAYDTQSWAGSPGLSQKGTDYLASPAGTSLIPQNHEGWVEFRLQPDIVKDWLGKKRNPGLKICPRVFDEKGQSCSFRSSETFEDSSTQPKLVLNVEMDTPTYERYLKQKAVRSLENTRHDFEAQVKKWIGSRDKAGNRARKLVSTFENRIKGFDEILQSRESLSEERLCLLVENMDQLRSDLRDFGSSATIAQAASYNEERSLKSDFALAAADSMTNVLREPGKSDVSLTEKVKISMAKNEFESLQLVLIPIDNDIEDATWSVTDLRSEKGDLIPASDISIHVMGYMKSIKPAIPSDSQWWPVPILDFMQSVDVPRGEVQPLWVTVHTLEKTPPGIYTGTIEVKARNLQKKKMGLNVEVWDFAIPKEQHLLTVWGNVEVAYKTVYGESYNRKMARRMFDFFIDHRLALNTLYAQQSAGEPKANAFVGYPTLSDPLELKRLWDAGSRWWNLGYIHPVFAERAGKSMDEYVPDFLEMLKESLRIAETAGLPRSNMSIYLFDETNDFDLLASVAKKVKKAFPDIALMTTGYDRSYGVKKGPIDDSIDIWCPLTPRFVEDWDIIKEGRKLGKKAWWYVCCGPKGKNDLNFFCQFPAIRSRLLMGAAAWKYQPDGFLYYRVSGWRDYKKPIDSGPLTDWKPYFLPGPDGDGELICPGPNGPLSTLQFENIRDGMEDYEYWWVLNDLVSRAKEKGKSVQLYSDLLQVPEDLLDSLTSYSEDPAKLRENRRRIAGAIVALRDQ